MKYLRLFFLTYMVLMGCSAKKNMDSSKEATLTDSSFKDFFLRFSIDSAFQTSRIKFPLGYSYYDGYDSDSLSVDTIKLEDWTFIDFSDDSLAAKNEEDAYQVEFTETDPNVVEYLRKGIDNGIFVNYHFSKVHGKWYLTKIADRSN